MTQYHFNDNLRQAFGFDTPNYAALFLGMGIVILAASGTAPDARRRMRVSLLAGEAVFWYGLCMTYSRGGFVAAWAGILYLAVLRVRDAGGGRSTLKHLSDAGLWLAPRAIIATACLLATSFYGRLSIAYSAADGSVLNRLDLWRGAARMFVDSGGAGWGLGLGARAFSEWYIPLDLEHRYLTFVNLFLTIAVDLGAVWFSVTVLGLSLLMLVPFYARRDGSGLSFARLIPVAGSVLVVFAVANVFSVLLLSQACNAIALASVVVLAVAHMRIPIGRRRWPILGGVAAAVVSLGGLVAVGVAAAGCPLEVVADVPENRVALMRDADADRVLWIRDRSTRDATESRALRRELQSCGSPVHLTTNLLDAGDAGRVSGEVFDTVVLWGERWVLAADVNAGRRLLAYPTLSDERADHLSFDELILDPADLTGENAYWSARAAAIQARVRFVEPDEVMRVVLGAGGAS